MRRPLKIETTVRGEDRGGGLAGGTTEEELRLESGVAARSRFIIGFFLVAIPWYVAAFILLCAGRIDHREKPGYVACTIAVSASVQVIAPDI
ncbi:60S ribosomal protein L18a-1 [Platanthera guangdongensis]|uniref:60S ribosomal protein L18a-1 n=1 Tax=Platanthera guangdongensis TaxID=2320717 RepID=A0ABR2LGJ3_9ASPA